MTLNVVQLPVSNLMDVPVMLRRLADDIEAGNYGTVESVFSIVESETEIALFGHGEARDCFYNIGLLEYAKADMLEHARQVREE